MYNICVPHTWYRPEKVELELWMAVSCHGECHELDLGLEEQMLVTMNHPKMVLFKRRDQMMFWCLQILHVILGI